MADISFERLDVFRVALEFRALVARIVPRRANRELRDQLDRASTSVVLNIAEGAGRWQRNDKRRFYEVARGSASESAAVLAVLEATGEIGSAPHAQARELAARVVAMLTRLCQRTA